jgi:hypothetical protein
MSSNFGNERMENIAMYYFGIDHLGGLVVRAPDYRSRGPGFDSPSYQIF